MTLVLTGPFPQLPAPCVIGLFGQTELEFLDERLIQRPPIPKRAQKQFVGFLGVADLKQRPQVAGVGDNAVVLENLLGIVIGDVIILNFPGVIRKGNAKGVQCLGQLGVRGNVFAPPQLQCLLVTAHKTPPCAIRSVASFRRLGRGLGLTLPQILTHANYRQKSNEKFLILQEIRNFLMETTELESVTSCV